MASARRIELVFSNERCQHIVCPEQITPIFLFLFFCSFSFFFPEEHSAFCSYMYSMCCKLYVLVLSVYLIANLIQIIIQTCTEIQIHVLVGMYVMLKKKKKTDQKKEKGKGNKEWKVGMESRNGK